MSEQCEHEVDSDLVVMCEPLLLGTENLAEEVEFDKDEFFRGLKDGSYQAGVFTALINSGMDMDSATTFLLNTQNIHMNVQIARIQAEATKEASKNTKVAVENQQL